MNTAHTPTKLSYSGYSRGRFGKLAYLALPLLIFLSIPSPLSAENPSPFRSDMLEWKALMAENRHALKKDDLTKFEMLYAFRAVIHRACMPNLPKTLSYDGNPTNPKCLELIDKILAVDPGNSAALCARDGIDSVTCRDSYLRQVVWDSTDMVKLKVYKNNPTLSNTNSQYDAAQGELDSEISRMQGDYAREKRKETLDLLTAKYQKLFQHICKDIRFAIATREEVLGEQTSDTSGEIQSPAPSLRENRGNRTPQRGGHRDRTNLATQSPASPNPARTGKPSSMVPVDNFEAQFPSSGKNKKSAESPTEKLLKQLDRGKLETKKNEESLLPTKGLIQVRILPERCLRAVNQLLNIDPLSATALCQRDGEYSTFCIDAKRQAKKDGKTIDTTSTSTHPKRPARITIEAF